MTAEHLLEEYGFALLPLQEDKRPHFGVLESVYGSNKWAHLRERKATSRDVQHWYEAAGGQLGIGIITGRPSGITVADLDHPESADFRHPPTPIVRTGRGWHIYLRGTCRSAPFAWGELRSEGNYAVAPGSVHESGARYEWIVGPEDHAFASLAELLTDKGQGFNKGQRAVPSQYQSLATAPARDRRHLLASDTNVEATLSVLGIEAGIGPSFHCVIPGNRHHRPTATICPYTARYHDWRHRVYHSLAEVYRAQLVGDLAKLPKVGHAIWWERLWHVAGVAPLDVEPLPLPGGVTPAELKIAEGFALIWAIKSRTRPGEPITFSARFAADWCGLDRDTASKAIRGLVERGALDPIRNPATGAFLRDPATRAFLYVPSWMPGPA